jgi:hypothetical protein
VLEAELAQQEIKEARVVLAERLVARVARVVRRASVVKQTREDSLRSRVLPRDSFIT